MKKLVYLLVLLISVACSSDSQEVEKFLTLSSTQISVDSKKATRIITVNSSSSWTIDRSTVPTWCTIDEQTNENFIITILPNNTHDDRTVVISAKNSTTTNSLTINQHGVTENQSLNWHTFPVNTFSEVSDTDTEYSIKASSMFITSSMRDKIFHGNLIKKEFTLGEDIQPSASYTFNPITISALIGGKFYLKESVIPSMDVTNSLFDEMKSDYPTESVAYVTESPIEFISYKQLHVLGVGNIGVNLDEVFTGKSYTELDMGNRTGLIYTYSNVAFQADMDYPRNLVQEEIPAEEANKLAYVGSIAYGKTAFLIVETNYDYNYSKLVVNKIIRGEELEDDEKPVKNGLKAAYIYFKEDGSLSVSSGYQALLEYAPGFEKQPIIPLSFTVGNCTDNSVEDLEFTFELP